MTKSTSRSQVRLIASTNAIFGADEACAMLRISRDAIVLHDELVAWVERNSVVGSPRRG